MINLCIGIALGASWPLFWKMVGQTIWSKVQPLVAKYLPKK